jgi:NAD(P)-dependent dehydrogenase (short-subunit alcohol dehydrogenase family)
VKELKGKGAVVTGAASGIGKAIATAFIEAGASVSSERKEIFPSLADQEQRELSSFIDIFSPSSPVHQLAARTS